MAVTMLAQVMVYVAICKALDIFAENYVDRECIECNGVLDIS
jgi:hypothetical protein